MYGICAVKWDICRCCVVIILCVNTVYALVLQLLKYSKCIMQHHIFKSLDHPLYT
jgi:hypothetical protein